MIVTLFSVIGIILTLIGFSFLIHSGTLDYQTHDDVENLNSRQEFNKLKEAKIYNITGVVLLFTGFLFMQIGLYIEIGKSN